MPAAGFAGPSLGSGVLGAAGGNSAAGVSSGSPSHFPGGGGDLIFASAFTRGVRFTGHPIPDGAAGCCTGVTFGFFAGGSEGPPEGAGRPVDSFQAGIVGPV